MQFFRLVLYAVQCSSKYCTLQNMNTRSTSKNRQRRETVAKKSKITKEKNELNKVLQKSRLIKKKINHIKKYIKSK